MAKKQPAKSVAKAKKPAAKKAAGKPAAKKAPAKPVAKKAVARPAEKKAAAKPAALAAKNARPVNGGKHVETRSAQANGRPQKTNNAKLTPFLVKQRERLLQLRDSMLDAMAGVAKDNLRTRAEGSEASAFGMHQADAGSDAYDRDFALSLLSQEQDALYEIEEALKRIETGSYGVCEMSGKPIAHARLEALPFARYTVECQSQIEKQGKVSRARVPVTSLFGLTDEEPGESEEEEPATDSNKE
jgi:DnaK suppressor protein